MANTSGQDSWERRIAKKIQADFYSRVIPTQIIFYLPCLQREDQEKVRQIEINRGASDAAQELFLILQRRPDWISDLTTALKNPSVGLIDLGEKLEKLCQQIVVTINGEETPEPGGCSDGVHCSPPSEKSEEDKPPTKTENDKDRPDKDDSSSTETRMDVDIPKTDDPTARQNLVYTVFQTVFQNVKVGENIEEAMNYAKSLIIEIDGIAQKCIEITFRMDTLEKLEAFWNLYQSGGLKAALIRDILTPSNRQMMRKEAAEKGIQLGQISLDVSIREDNYNFVKDVLQSREEPLLESNTIESIILHGSRHTNMTQHDRNEALKLFRACLPRQLKEVTDDPFVHDKVPEYFAYLASLNPKEAIKTFYQMMADKLREEIIFTVESETVEAIIFALSTFGNKFTYVRDNNHVHLTPKCSAILRISITNDIFDYICVPTTADGNMIEVTSDLVFDFIWLSLVGLFPNIAGAPSDSLEEIGRRTNTKFFSLVASIVLKPLDALRFLKATSVDYTGRLSEYLLYRMYLKNEDLDKFIQEMPFLQMSDSIPGILDHYVERGFQLQFWAYVPTRSKYFVSDKEIDYQERIEASKPQRLDGKRIRVIINNSDEDYVKCIPLLISKYRDMTLNDNLYNSSLSLPGSFDNPLPLFLAFAKLANLLGSGMLKLEPQNNIDGNTERFELKFQILPSLFFQNALPDDLEFEFKKKQESVDEHRPSTGDTPQGHIKDYMDNTNGLLYLDFENCHLSKMENAFNSLASALQNGLQVHEINLTETAITALHVERLCKASMTSNISRLVISGNPLLKSKENPYSFGLEFLQGLQMLEVRDCKLGDEGISKMSVSLEKLKNLRSIDFSKNQITDKGLYALCIALRENRGLRAVRLHENKNFGNVGGFALRMLFKNLKYLEIVNVCFCGLGDRGLEYMALSLANKKIRKLNIRQNGISSDGSKKFFNSLINNKDLNHLEYGNNEIGGYSSFYPNPKHTGDEVEVDPFLNMIESNVAAFEYLGLWKCGIGRTALLDNDRWISRMSLLTEFVLQSNDLQDKHAVTIGGSLKYLKNIQILMLRDNEIGHVGAGALSRGIVDAPTLQEIILDRNNIHDNDVLAELIMVSTQSLPNLVKLDISHNIQIDEIKMDAGGGTINRYLVATAEQALLEAETEKEDFKSTVSGWSKLGSASLRNRKPTIIVV